MINENGLIDMGFSGHAFTWNNTRVGRDNIQERLDRCFANGEWKTVFQHAHVTHLPTFHSDHRPILINSNPAVSPRPHPFRFEAMWIRDESIVEVIKTAWTKGHPMPNFPHLITKLKTTKLALKQ